MATLGAAAAATGDAVRTHPAPRLGHSLRWNLIADLCARGASLWLAFFCARALTLPDFGRFMFALALVQYVWILGDASLNGGYAARELALRPPDSPRLATRFYLVRLMAAVLVTGAILLVLPLLPVPDGSRRTVAAASVYFVAYAAFPDWLFRGFSQFRFLAAANALYALALVGFTWVLLRRTPDPAVAAAAWGGSFAIGSLFLVVVALRRGMLAPASVTFVTWWPHFRRSIVFSTGSLFAIGCVQAPAILIGMLSGARETGLFAAGFRLESAFIGLFSVLWWPLMPVLTGMRPESPEYRVILARVARGGLLASLGAAAAFTLFPREILGTLFGAEYREGALALAIGAWALPAYAASGLLEQASLALSRERLRVRIMGSAFALLIVSAAIAVPRLGATGAAISLLVTFLFSATMYIAVLWRELPVASALGAARTEVGLVLGTTLAWLALARFTPLAWWLVLPVGAVPAGVITLFWGPFRARRSREPAAPAREPLRCRVLPALRDLPLVSVVIAVRNESRHIRAALDAVLAQDWRNIEVLVVDGASDDDTAAIVRQVAAAEPRVKLLANPRRLVAPGLNIGIRAACGEIVVRVDGHCRVPPDYVSVCVRVLREGNAECVGGPVRAAGETPLGRGIAYAMSTPFGVGGAAFRWARESREVDHVPFLAVRREIFESIGLFDERLVRNQDDEFSDRLRRAGGRIRLEPRIPVVYWSRPGLLGLWRQYQGYGYWKVRVIRMRGGWPSSVRHVVPAVFVLACAGSLLAAAAGGSWVLPALVFGPYALFLAAAMLSVGAQRRDVAVLVLPLALATLHAAYGVGFLHALLQPAPGPA